MSITKARTVSNSSNYNNKIGIKLASNQEYFSTTFKEEWQVFFLKWKTKKNRKDILLTFCFHTAMFLSEPNFLADADWL